MGGGGGGGGETDYAFCLVRFTLYHFDELFSLLCSSMKLLYSLNSSPSKYKLGEISVTTDIYFKLLFFKIVIPHRYRAESWRGVWTLVLLMYAMTIETSSSLLFCPTLTSNSNGTSESITVSLLPSLPSLSSLPSLPSSHPSLCSPGR